MDSNIDLPLDEGQFEFFGERPTAPAKMLKLCLPVLIASGHHHAMLELDFGQCVAELLNDIRCLRARKIARPRSNDYPLRKMGVHSRSIIVRSQAEATNNL